MKRILIGLKGSTMKKLLLCLIISTSFLSVLTPVLSVEITSCDSGGTAGVCEIGKTCTCKISGECSNGNLLLYLTDLTNPICSPQIIGNSVSMTWEYCDVNEGLLYAMADCDEGQSTQKSIMISQAKESTETTTPVPTTVPATTVPVTTEAITHECFGGKGYCEDIMADCQVGYSYCPEYNNDCPGFDEKCCCLTKELGGVTPPINVKLVAFMVLAVVIGVVIFLFFMRQTKEGMTFKKLYEKWSR